MQKRGERRRRMSFLEAARQKRYVMGSVILRDMRTRFFNHGLGFIIQCLWPLVHMLVIILINTFAGRSAPYGESPMLFFAVGVIPVLTFSYISRFMSYSILVNRSMLSFPAVTVTDVLFGRAALEVLAGFVTIFLMWIFFTFAGIAPYPIDPTQAVLAYLSTVLLAVGIGSIAGVITSFFPMFATAYSLMNILIYLSSGAVFVTPNLPDQIAIPLSYLPVVQCVEWLRWAYFDGYSDRLLDRGYLLGFGLGALFIGLASERVSRRILFDSN